MTSGPAILPSIRISKTGASELAANATPASPEGDNDSLTADNDRQAPSLRNINYAASTRSSNGAGTKSPRHSTGDPEKLQSSTSWTRKPMITRDSTVDPLTMHILRRTGTEGTVLSKLRQDGGVNEEHANEPGPGNGGNSPDGIRHTDGQPPKKKGVSFLSRIIGGKKKGGDASDDEEAFEGDRRTEGMDAHVFSQPIGYIPRFPAPPKYIRVRSHNKSNHEFNQTFLAQELYRKPIRGEEGLSAAASTASLGIPEHKSGAIWTMKWSKDGRYLAAGGQDKVVRVWQVISSKEEREAHEREEDAAGLGRGSVYTEGSGVRLNAPVFRSEPIHEYIGHTADVLDLSWSKNNFLLSSSMDKTVRLWHVSRKECLCCFQHSDFVTAICFHPRDDRFFLAGSLDSKLRLWSIPDKSIAFWNELPDLITAVAFTPDGRMAIAGCLNGQCLFYETEGLRYNTQVLVRSSHGRNAKGSKITGIETINFPPEDPNGDVKILITSNDSRVRLYNARDKSLETKFKGYENTCSQIHATFSDDAKYIISGSENRRAYIWNLGSGDGEKKNKQPVEYFEAHPAIVTVAIMAPTKTRQFLGSSGDPLYDLCNPPPVTLVSRSDSIASSKKTSNGEGSKPPAAHKTPEESPAYALRSAHSDGNIIVTADYTGRIKVFRQDCAFVKRKNESWETGSTFSKKIGSGIFHNGVKRRNSLSQGAPPDQILSWRQSIGSLGSVDGSSGGNRSGRNGSISPRKSMSTMSVASNGTTQKFLRSGSVKSRAPAQSRGKGTIGPQKTQASSTPKSLSQRFPSDILGTPPRDRRQPLSKDPVIIQKTGQGVAYYNSRLPPHTRAGRGSEPPTPKSRDAVSSDESADDKELTSEDEEDEVEDEEGESGSEMVCKRCGGASFKAKQSRKGQQKLVCVKCNLIL